MAEILTRQDITATWLAELLRSGGALDAATSVPSFAITPFGEEESMVSALWRVNLGTEGLHERAEALAITMLKRASAEILRVEAHTAYP